jgi:hypothetical protein
MGTLALRVASTHKTYHRGYTEAVVFHMVDLAVETDEICEHTRGRHRCSRRVKSPEPGLGQGGAEKLEAVVPTPCPGITSPPNYGVLRTGFGWDAKSIMSQLYMSYTFWPVPPWGLPVRHGGCRRRLTI